MTSIEENRYSMYRSVKSLLKENESAFSNIAALAKASYAFEKTFIRIGEIDAGYLSISGGRRAGKERAREEAVDAALKTAGLLFVLGRKNKDENLKVLSGTNKTKLLRMRENDIIITMKSIKDQAKSHIGELKELHGGAEEELADISSKLEVYEKRLGERESAEADTHALRVSLTHAFEEADGILKEELDNLMLLLKEKNGDLYNRYKSARVIHDLGLKKRKKDGQEQSEGKES
jgi:hypothetical protein